MGRHRLEARNVKVISIFDKLETWQAIFTSPTGDMQVLSSSHGRLKFVTEKSTDVVLDFVDSVMLSQIISQTYMNSKGIQH